MNSPERGTWFRWTPDHARNEIYRDLASAVAQFESLETAGGEESARWLREDALLDYPSTITHVLKSGDRIDGFFAISSDSIALTRRDREALPHEHSSPVPTPIQGASLIAWIARHRDGGTPGRVIMHYAISIALKVADLQGTPVAVVDPFDPETAGNLQERYGFHLAAHGHRVRLWVPLHPHNA